MEVRKAEDGEVENEDYDDQSIDKTNQTEPEIIDSKDRTKPDQTPSQKIENDEKDKKLVEISIAARAHQPACLWTKITDLVHLHKPINLGQGSPEVKVAKFIRRALIKTQLDSKDLNINQYTKSRGHPRLMNAIKKWHYLKYGEILDSEKNILSTIGADGAIFCSIMAIIDPGDKVIVFDPAYDSYSGCIKLAQGVAIFVTLNIIVKHSQTKDEPSREEITFSREELNKAFEQNPKMIIINSPHNPSGKLFNSEELKIIADKCIEYNTVCLCDDVYETFIYPDKRKNEPIPRISKIEGMKERTIHISSAGKLFNVTGWKLGWAIGPENIIQAMHTINSICNYTCPSITQEAIAICLEKQIRKTLLKKKTYWEHINNHLKDKRKKFYDCLMKTKLIKPIFPDAGYFMMADASALIEKYKKQDLIDQNPLDFIEWLIMEKKIAVIPVSNLYSVENEHLGKNMIRICLFKKKSTINKAMKMMKKL